VDPDRPLVMLFLGSSGIGKTELAKQVTYFLNGDESTDKTSCSQSFVEMEQSGAFMRIDMSEYQHDHTVSNLTGMLSFNRINGHADPSAQAHPRDMWWVFPSVVIVLEISPSHLCFLCGRATMRAVS
jgi:hypothetical protein